MNAALELINSEHWYGRAREHRKDQLEIPGRLRSYLASIDSPRLRLTAIQREELIRLRTLLRKLATKIITTGRLGQRDMKALNDYVSPIRFRRRLAERNGRFRLELVPEERDWAAVLAAIAASFVELLESGDIDRLKLCANAECGCVFCDESKNRSRRWCGASSCGPADKVRRFRARHRAPAA